MKDKIKGLVLGILIGTIITGSIVNASTLYNVFVGGIKIVVDGRLINPTDVNGNKVEPMIYNGTTYLPVRAVASALGKEVYWDGPNYTVYLGNMNGKLQYPTVELENMVSITGQAKKTTELTDNYGNGYSRAIYGFKNSTTEYLLNMKYSRFKGVLYVPKGKTSNDTNYLKIVADGKTIYTSPKMNKTSRPVNINVDITGYNDVKIEFCGGETQVDQLMLCLGEAGFYQ